MLIKKLFDCGYLRLLSSLTPHACPRTGLHIDSSEFSTQPTQERLDTPNRNAVVLVLSRAGI